MVTALLLCVLGVYPLANRLTEGTAVPGDTAAPHFGGVVGAATRVVRARGDGGGATGAPAAVELEVRDRGSGYAEEEENRLFEKLYRGKAEGVRGAGLGLAICRAIVMAHRGSIEALHREGGGAIFRIRLPLDGRQL